MTVLTSSSKGHVVLFACGAWGHIRALCCLVPKIVKSRSTHITFLVASSFLDRVNTELARNFDAGEDEVRNRIRVVSLAQDGPLINAKAYHNSFSAAWSKLASAQAVHCTQTGIQYQALPVPSAIILDIFALDSLHIVRKYSHESVKIVCWYCCATTGLFRELGPESKGGRGPLRPKAVLLAAETGRSVLDILDELSCKTIGQQIQVPSLPLMYDYEFYPQNSPYIQGVGLFRAGACDFLFACDAILVNTPESYEPEANLALREWFAETSRPAYFCGPLHSSIAQAHTQEQQSPHAVEIARFLDSIAVTHGERSLVYFSFGTLFWPVEPETIWTFLDVLIEKNIPFIFSHAAPFAVIPADVVQKVKDYKAGYLSPWSPQQLILGHKATGWFVTHAGQNSVMEAITLGVPMICWPFAADQPTNAINLTVNHDVAYELFEVRTGEGLKPLHRLGKAPTGSLDAVRVEARDILTKAFAEDGQKKRANILKLRKEISKVWEENGSSQRDFEAMLAFMGLQ